MNRTGSMRSRRGSFTIALALALAALTAAGCGSSSNTASTSGKTVTVGESTTLSGPFGGFGKGGLNGVKLAASDINSSGGLLGKKVKVASADDAADPATGSTNTRNMILKDKVVALFGPVSSAVASAEETLAVQFKLPIFMHTSNDVGLTKPQFVKNAFSFVPNTDMEPAAIAAAVAKQAGGRSIKVATITPNYSFGLDSVKAFLKDLKADGVKFTVTTQQTPALGASSYTPYISAILSSSPDYVFAGQYAGDLITFTKQAAGFGLFKKAKVIGMYDLDALQSLGSSAPAGAIAYDRAPFWTINSGQMADFVKRYKAAYGSYPSEWAIMAYTAAQGWAYGVKKAGSFDLDKVSAALSGGATVPTIRGPVTLRACDHQA